ncbi:MucR family transcriptional regulator [Devosia sp. 1635]|uniref:MucR family transcriptional regulator n=1 Tax=Devosia sp. 1635 TaxID=2726066 RepID=UPI00156523FF|nr:MucR family transcriptional regulator [Devosia sp. 1635]
MTATAQELTAQIVSSYLANNQVQADMVPAILQSVYDKLNSLDTTVVVEPAAPAVPAVPIEKSITHDHLICLEDGKKFKSLKRHLQTKFNMTPEEYRAKWGLPGDYPMVAPNYSAKRSQLAKNSGLGLRPLEKAA